MKNFLKELRRYPIVIGFFCFVLLYTAADCCVRNRVLDEYENRQLAQFPPFSWASLAANEWTAKYETYVQDQFLGRHEWIVAKSVAESLLLRTENNGVVYGADDYQFAKFTALPAAAGGEGTQLERNIEFLTRFTARHPGLVSVMVVPSAANILADHLPAGAPLLDENPYLDALFAAVGDTARVIDVRDAFAAAAGDTQLYYRTDHHWTTDGAYLAYQTAAGTLDAGRFDAAAHAALTAPGFTGTNYNKSLKYDTVADDILYYPLDNPLSVQQLLPDGSVYSREDGGLYDLEKLAAHDKYAMFLRGNNGYSTIAGDGGADRRILVIKDSYANCFVPFLTADYGQIDVVDLRFFKTNVETLIDLFNYTDVLVLYNFQTFATETTVFYLNAMIVEE